MLYARWVCILLCACRTSAMRCALLSRPYVMQATRQVANLSASDATIGRQSVCTAMQETRQVANLNASETTRQVAICIQGHASDKTSREPECKRSRHTMNLKMDLGSGNMRKTKQMSESSKFGSLSKR